MAVDGDVIMALLLIIEDNPETNEAVCEYLKSAGHKAISVINGNDAVEIIKTKINAIDLVVLDIMLPDVSGIDLLNTIRALSNVPVLMLTALDDESTQAICFDGLADDYITKPFSMLLLGKRVTALLRRSGKTKKLTKMAFGDVIVDFGGYSASDGNGAIDITPKEIELLKLLVEHKGLVLSRAQILDDLWANDNYVMERLIDTYIKNIRKKLRLDCIVTVKGVGYKYEEKN